MSQPPARLIDECSGKHHFELPEISGGFISILLCSSYSSSFSGTLLAGTWVTMVLLLRTFRLHSQHELSGFQAFRLASKFLLLLLCDVFFFLDPRSCLLYQYELTATSGSIQRVKTASARSLAARFTPKLVINEMMSVCQVKDEWVTVKPERTLRGRLHVLAKLWEKLSSFNMKDATVN